MKKYIAIILCMSLLLGFPAAIHAQEQADTAHIHIDSPEGLPYYTMACPNNCGVLGEIQFDLSFLDYPNQQYVYCLRCPSCGVYWYYNVPYNVVKIKPTDEIN